MCLLSLIIVIQILEEATVYKIKTIIRVIISLLILKIPRNLASVVQGRI